MILGFSGHYRFLSNFHPSPLIWMGHSWPNVENAYQWAKESDPEKVELFKMMTPGQAKKYGGKGDETWSHRKVSVMTELVEAKFDQNEDLSELLLATGIERIIELNTWGDTFWGMVYSPDGRLVGTNRLGDILMLIRMRLLGEGLCV